jgi:hypothetical protein
MKNASRWNWNRGEYLREVGWFLGILSSFVYFDGILQKNKNPKTKNNPKKPKKRNCPI